MTASQAATAGGRSDTNVGQSAHIDKTVTASDRALHHCQLSFIRKNFTTIPTRPYNADANIGQRLGIPTM